MKRLIACVSLVAAASTAALPSTAPHPSPAHPPAKAASHPGSATTHPAKNVAKAKCKVAPADEYFGKLKLSILGIRNTIKDQGLKVDYEPEKASATLGSITLAEDAIRDWEHKYPCDSWLPGTLYALQHFYGKIHNADGVKRVHSTFAWLRHDYPKSSVVQVARREDGQASAVPVPPTATISAGTQPASAAPAASAGPLPAPGPSAGTAVPGTAPPSVTNAQRVTAASPPPGAPH